MKVLLAVLFLFLLHPDDPFVLMGNEPPLNNNIVITIDDCSIEENVRWALNLLVNRSITATFFPNTRYINYQDPQLWRDIVAAGNEIGYHTRNHQRLLTPEQLNADFDLFTQEIRQILDDPNYTIRYVRPPGGYWNEDWMNWAESRGLITVKWNATLPAATPIEALATIRNRERGGSILLVHTGLNDIQWLQDNLDNMLHWTDADGNPLLIRSISDSLGD